MATQPLVSVIVITHNQQQELTNALRSLTRQTYADFEILVVNNGGEDVGQLVRNTVPGLDVSYIRQEEKQNHSVARNAGLRAAKGEFIAYLDDKDLYYPLHIDFLVSFLRDNPNYGAAYTDAHLGRPFVFAGGLVTVRKEELPAKNFDRTQLLINNYIPLSCMMHRASCLAHSGLFDESLTALEDWDLWIRLSELYPIRRIPIISAQIFSTGKNLVAPTLTHTDNIDALLTIYRKHETTSSENIFLSQMRVQHIIGQYRELAEQHEKDETYEQAERLWQRITELSGRPEDLLRLGMVRQKMGKEDQAQLTLNLVKELRYPRSANGY